MTGISPGASPAPTSSPHAPRDKQGSRARRPHGFISMGTTTAVVHSTRKADQALSVSVTVGTGALQLAAAMTPTQARSMARALMSAAEAVDHRDGGVR